MREPDLERVIIRSAVPRSDDFALIHATWKNQLWFSESRPITESNQFYKDASREINSILSQQGCICRIACLANNETALIGWSVLHGNKLMFIYVKKDYRGRGVGRLLAKGFETFAEPVTKIGQILAKKFGLKENTNAQEEKRVTASASTGNDSN